VSDLASVTLLLVVIRLLPPRMRAGPSDRGHFPDVFWMAAYDHVRSSLFLADILTSWVLIRGCVSYIGPQIFTLWQKSKVRVRIIFDGILYSKFYGTLVLNILLSFAQWQLGVSSVPSCFRDTGSRISLINEFQAVGLATGNAWRPYELRLCWGTTR